VVGLLNSDFNLIYCAEDKNNVRLNRWQMGQFCRFLNVASLKEIHLNRRLYMCSNERAHPTLERIDRVFISIEWDAIFPDHVLHPLSSLCSDHAVHFRSFWPCFPIFQEVVAREWHCPLGNVSPFTRLDWLLCHMARCLKSWCDRTIGSIRVQ
jgi:hypothetical protein